MGDHGLQEGTEEIKRMEKREGEGTVSSIEGDWVTIRDWPCCRLPELWHKFLPISVETGEMVIKNGQR